MKTIRLAKLTDTEQQVHKSIQTYFEYIDPIWHKYITVDIDGSVWVWNRKPHCNDSGYWGEEDNISMHLDTVGIVRNPEYFIYKLNKEEN